MRSRPFVIKEWRVGAQPVDDADHYVVVRGRQAGLFAWLLNLLGIAATTSLLVSSNRLEFLSASLAGEKQALIPLERVSSTCWGFRKPWMQACGVFFASWLVNGLLRVILGGSFGEMTVNADGHPLILIAFVAGIVSAIAYYQLNRTYVWGVVEVSGVAHVIPFKRSVIEGQNITQESAAYASHVIQALIEAKSER